MPNTPEEVPAKDDAPVLPAAAEAVMLPPPQELPLPYFVEGDVVGIVGQNKRLRYTWMFFLGGPVAALMSNMRFGQVSPIPTIATGVACLIVFIISWVSLGAGYVPAESAPILFNRRKKQVFLGRYDEKAECLRYYTVPYAALRFTDAFGGFGSSTLNVTVSEEGAEPWSLTKFGRLIDSKETGSLSYLLELFMEGHDVIKQNPKAAAEYAAEMKKRPALPPEAEEFMQQHA